jgi:hypothetical protein
MAGRLGLTKMTLLLALPCPVQTGGRPLTASNLTNASSKNTSLLKKGVIGMFR